VGAVVEELVKRGIGSGHGSGGATSPFWARCVSNQVLGAHIPIFETLRAQNAR